MFRERSVWENICDVREDRDLLLLNFASPNLRGLIGLALLISPRAHLAELFSTAQVYKSKGTWVRERSSAIPKINEPIGRRLLPLSACGGGLKGEGRGPGGGGERVDGLRSSVLSNVTWREIRVTQSALRPPEMSATCLSEKRNGLSLLNSIKSGFRLTGIFIY